MLDKASKAIDEVKEEDEIKKVIDNISKQVEKGTSTITQGINDIVNKPEVKEQLDKVKDVADDAMKKVNETIKNITKPKDE